MNHNRCIPDRVDDEDADFENDRWERDRWRQGGRS